MEQPRDGEVGSRSDAFSLVDGGPFNRVLGRARLMRPPLELLGRRTAALVLTAWLPLFMFSAAAGTLYAGAAVPFLEHLAVHARLLVSVPLLLLAEVIVHDRMRIIVRRFEVQGLVPPASRGDFDEILRSSLRIGRYPFPEGVLLLVALTLGHWLWARHVAMPVDTWYGRWSGREMALTPAGTWYAFVSLPLFRFLLYRWYFRLGIWYRLLWKVSRLPLNLNPAHPDRAAGLGFLSQSLVGFAPVLAAHTVMVGGLVADQIRHRGAALSDFKMEIGALVAILLLMGVLPLCFFAVPLSRARRAALGEHAVLAARYVEEFTRKWLRGTPSPSPLGHPDIQSMADLGTYYQALRETRLVPVGKKALVQLAVILVLPLLPLALTMMPLEEILDRLAKLVL